MIKLLVTLFIIKLYAPEIFFDLPYHSCEKFDLDSLSENECKSEFRFDKRDIYKLCDVSEIPEEIRF